MASIGFNGFSKEFFDFFSELKTNNNREWFEANKPRFKDVVQGELSAFVSAMAPRLEKISPHYVADPRPNGKSIFRIYRDVRFSKNKAPYKENAGVHFRHTAGKDAHAPGFYVHLAGDEVFYGGGVWAPASEPLRQIRQAIAGQEARWRKIVNAKGFVKTFGALHGDALKRPPKGFDADHPLIDDLKRKSFFAMNQSTKAVAMKPDFAQEVTATFRQAAPLMGFLTEAIGAPF